jgi:hypothetical protein
MRRLLNCRRCLGGQTLPDRDQDGYPERVCLQCGCRVYPTAPPDVTLEEARWARSMSGRRRQPSSNGVRL